MQREERFDVLGAELDAVEDYIGKHTRARD